MSRGLGLDWVETTIHVFVTACIGIALSSAAGPQDEEIALGVVLAASAVVYGWRRRRALRRGAEPGEGLTTGEMAAERIADLEARVADLEAAHGRLLELEERVDFSERLLARAPLAGRPALPDGGRGPEEMRRG